MLKRLSVKDFSAAGGQVRICVDVPAVNEDGLILFSLAAQEPVLETHVGLVTQNGLQWDEELAQTMAITKHTATPSRTEAGERLRGIMASGSSKYLYLIDCDFTLPIYAEYGETQPSITRYQEKAVHLDGCGRSLSAVDFWSGAYSLENFAELRDVWFNSEDSEITLKNTTLVGENLTAKGNVKLEGVTLACQRLYVGSLYLDSACQWQGIEDIDVMGDLVNDSVCDSPDIRISLAENASFAGSGRFNGHVALALDGDNAKHTISHRFNTLSVSLFGKKERLLLDCVTEQGLQIDMTDAPDALILKGDPKDIVLSYSQAAFLDKYSAYDVLTVENARMQWQEWASRQLEGIDVKELAPEASGEIEIRMRFYDGSGVMWNEFAYQIAYKDAGIVPDTATVESVHSEWDDWGSLHQRVIEAYNVQQDRLLSRWTETYSESGAHQSVQSVFEYDENGALKASGDTYREWDAQGELVKEFTEIRDANGALVDGGSITPSAVTQDEQEEFIYDENGEVMAKVVTRTELSAQANPVKEIMEISDKNGVLLSRSEISYSYSASGAYSQDEKMLVYDENGEVTEKSDIHREYNDWCLIREVMETRDAQDTLLSKNEETYEWDEARNMIRSVWERRDAQDNLLRKRETTYEHDEEDDVIRDVVETRYAQDVLLSRFETKYQDGKPTNKLIAYYEPLGQGNESWLVNSGKESYSYDENGARKVNREMYEYDQQGNIVASSVTLRYEDEEWNTISSNTEVYDADHRLTEIIDCTLDQREDGSYTETELHTLYNENGEIIGRSRTIFVYDDQWELVSEETEELPLN